MSVPTSAGAAPPAKADAVEQIIPGIDNFFASIIIAMAVCVGLVLVTVTLLVKFRKRKGNAEQGSKPRLSRGDSSMSAMPFGSADSVASGFNLKGSKPDPFANLKDTTGRGIAGSGY